MKKILLKKLLCILTALAIILAFGVCAVSCDDEDDDREKHDEKEDISDSENSKSNLGIYNVVIKSYRLYGKRAIITYSFTNNSNKAQSFALGIDAQVFQNGIECTRESSMEHLKEIKPGATFDVEVAYDLNDYTSDLEVEVRRVLSSDSKVVKKTFKLN